MHFKSIVGTIWYIFSDYIRSVNGNGPLDYFTKGYKVIVFIISSYNLNT
jgi:hypothetical protein